MVIQDVTEPSLQPHEVSPADFIDRASVVQKGSSGYPQSNSY